MQVILKEDVRHLGDVGDLVNVKPGYARNFLFPRGLAVYADPRQLNRIEHERRLIEARVNQMRTLAEANGELSGPSGGPLDGPQSTQTNSTTLPHYCN